ncbi:hypothetical protein GCM10027160_13730 [Streptomyces calidiresistens]
MGAAGHVHRVLRFGAGGGFRLARPAPGVTLLMIVEAVDGSSPPYECRGIRRRGRGALPADDCRTPCVLARRMERAHAAWRTAWPKPHSPTSSPSCRRGHRPAPGAA